MSTTTISGYQVTLESDGERVDCWITCNDRGTRYTASLAAADATGVLEDRNGRERPIPSSTLDRIGAWAESNGY
jgi:hypothetical protein